MLKFLAFFILYFTISSLAAEEPKTISVEKINSVKIIGKLGKPLHTIQKVECQIVDMSFTRAKADDGRKALLILSVDDKKLDKKVYIDLPSSTSQKDAVLNKVYKVWVYETIQAKGFPHEAFTKLKIPAMAVQRLQFSSQLIFLKEIK